MNEGTWVGNMFVLGKDAEKAIYLRCACLEEFIYAPGSSVNRCTLNGRAHAVCPKCRTLWDEKAEPRIGQIRRYFMLHLQLDQENKEGIEKAEFVVSGVGEAASPTEFVLKCIAEYGNTGYRGMMVTEMKESDYRAIRTQISEARGTLAALALLRMFGGLDDSDK